MGTLRIVPTSAKVARLPEFIVPGDKSIAHRAALFSSIAKGASKLTGFPSGADNQSTLSVLRSLGVNVASENDVVTIVGTGLAGLKPPGTTLDCGNSGTTIRLATGLLSGLEGTFTLAGDESLSKRPMARIIKPLQAMGATIQAADDDTKPPIKVRGQKLHGIRYDSPIASAQVKSAILLAGLSATSPTTICEPVLSRDHTERMLADMGANLQRSGCTVTLDPLVQSLRPLVMSIPGDPSSAAFFAALAPLAGGTLRGISLNPTRLGFFKLVQRHGIKIDWQETATRGGEPIGSISWQQSVLHTPFEISPTDVVDAIDEYPLLCVLAAVSPGTHILRNAAELRTKESDRINAMATMLKDAGIRHEEYEDGLVIHGGKATGPIEVDPRHDHRIAMAAAIFGINAGIPVDVHDAHVAQVSFPEFWTFLAASELANVEGL